MTDERPSDLPPLARALAGELLGSFLLVLFGTGSVAAAVLTGAQSGLWQVAVVWGFGVTLAIYASAALSGAHLNPAISLAFALWRAAQFPWRRLLPYAGAQLAGAIFASLVVAASFWPFLLRFEAANGLVRGAPGSERAAMIFGQYFPNPAMFWNDALAGALVTPLHALLVEAFGTGVLAFVIFSLTARTNSAAPAANLAPFFIGFTVAILISLFAPITQAGWNPARDLGPRLVSYALGWGAIALPGPQAGFWIYLVGPLIGAPIGAWLAERFGVGREPARPALEQSSRASVHPAAASASQETTP
jgi:MIP family channel proteins